jgi:hypothetical protein
MNKWLYRAYLVLCLLVAPYCIIVYAAMSDASAEKQAQSRWGSQAMIGTKRDLVQSNWSKLVGVKSVSCQGEFTVLGSGFNTWEQAFADADMHPVTVAGPFAGTITLRVQAWDNMGIVAGQFTIDGVNQAQVMITENPNALIDQSFDTRTVPDGMHVLCARAWDRDDNVAKSTAFLFTVAQSTGTANVVFQPGMVSTGLPGVNYVKAAVTFSQ